MSNKLWNVFLKNRVTRLLAILLTTLIFLAAMAGIFLVVKYCETSSTGTTGWHLISIGLLVLIGIFSALACAYHLILKSTKESREKTEKNVLRIIREINPNIRYILSCDIDEAKLARISWREISNILFIDLTDEREVKLLLKGIGNSLALTYHLLNNKKNQKKNMIEKKPQKWEETLKEGAEKIILYERIKEILQNLYLDIEMVALENGAKIIQGEKSTKYLVYADGKIIKLVNFISDL